MARIGMTTYSTQFVDVHNAKDTKKHTRIITRESLSDCCYSVGYKNSCSVKPRNESQYRYDRVYF